MADQEISEDFKNIIAGDIKFLPDPPRRKKKSTWTENSNQIPAIIWTRLKNLPNVTGVRKNWLRLGTRDSILST